MVYLKVFLKLENQRQGDRLSEVFCFIYEISFPIQVEICARKKRIII